MPPHTPRLCPQSCEVCAKTDDLTHCPDCLVVLYCSAAHRASDRSKHQDACTQVAASHANMRATSERLHNVASAFLPDYRSMDDEQRLKRVHATRSFLQARITHARLVLHELGSTDGSDKVTGRVVAAEAALEHMLDIIQIAEGDHLDVSNVVPAIYLALDRDQEAYVFVSWVTAVNKHYHDGGWADAFASHVDLRGSGVLEAVWDPWTRDLEQLMRERGLRLTHVVAVLLVKVRAYLDLRDVQNAGRALRGALPAEIVDLIRFHTLRGVLSQMPEVLSLDLEGTASAMLDVKGQIRTLWRLAREVDTVFWDRILKGRGTGEVDNYINRDIKALWERWQITPWLTTPGAMDVVEALRKEPVEEGW